MPDTEPKVKFDIDQKVLVFLENQNASYIPCIPMEAGSTITRIPHLSWIKYRGLARLYDEVYMRFIFEDEQVYIGLGYLPWLEDIPQRNPWVCLQTKRKGKRKKTVFSIKPRSLRYRKKHGLRKKLEQKEKESNA